MPDNVSGNSIWFMLMRGFITPSPKEINVINRRYYLRVSFKGNSAYVDSDKSVLLIDLKNSKRRLFLFAQTKFYNP